MQSLRIMGLIFLGVFFFLTSLGVTYSEAQPPFAPPGNKIPQTQLKGSCRIDPSITFTEEQAEKLAGLQQAYLDEIKPLWSELRDLRLDLRFLVSDPRSQSQAVLEKQMRMSAIQAKVENLRVSYLIKARSFFTKEQLERFPADCPLKMGRGYGAGRGLGRGPQKGLR